MGVFQGNDREGNDFYLGTKGEETIFSNKLSSAFHNLMKNDIWDLHMQAKRQGQS